MRPAPCRPHPRSHSPPWSPTGQSPPPPRPVRGPPRPAAGRHRTAATSCPTAEVDRNAMCHREQVDQIPTAKGPRRGGDDRPPPLRPAPSRTCGFSSSPPASAPLTPPRGSHSDPAERPKLAARARRVESKCFGESVETHHFIRSTRARPRVLPLAEERDGHWATHPRATVLARRTPCHLRCPAPTHILLLAPPCDQNHQS